MRSGDSAQASVIRTGDPGHGAPVMKPHDQIHAHANVAAIAAHHPHNLRISAPQRHEIDQRYGSCLGLELRFENQSARAIAAANLRLANWRYLPSAIFGISE